MDPAAIASGVNQALTEASGSSHFREHYEEVGDALVLEYHFFKIPEKIDLWRLAAALERVEGMAWSVHHGEHRLTLDGAAGGRKVAVFVSLRKGELPH
jgi:hypothetical protein